MVPNSDIAAYMAFLDPRRYQVVVSYGLVIPATTAAHFATGPGTPSTDLASIPCHVGVHQHNKDPKQQFSTLNLLGSDQDTDSASVTPWFRAFKLWSGVR